MFDTKQTAERAKNFLFLEEQKTMLQARRPKILELILGLQEQDLLGKADYKSLDKARAEVHDVDEKVQACDAGMLRIQAEMKELYRTETWREHHNLPALEREVAERRLEAVRELGRAKGSLEFWQGTNGVFGLHEVIVHELGQRLGSKSEPPYLAGLMAEVQAAAQEEHRRLTAAYPWVRDFKELREKVQFLKDTWSDPVALTGPPGSVDPALLCQRPRGESVRESFLEMFVKSAIKQARKEAEDGK